MGKIKILSTYNIYLDLLSFNTTLLILLIPLLSFSQSDSLLLLQTDTLCLDTALVNTDTLKVEPKGNHNFLVTFSTSYTSNDNWQEETFNLINLATKLKYSYSKTVGSWEKTYRISVNLSYIKYIDSLWYKNNDQTNISLIWAENKGEIKNSVLLKLNTQLTPSYDYLLEEKLTKDINANFLNPFSLEMGYGMNWDFWEESNLNIAFATIKIFSKPNYHGDIEIEQELIRSKNSILYMEYGFSSQLYISKPLSKSIEWENTCNVFFDELDKAHIFMDISNSIRIEVLSNLELSFNSFLEYDPDVSHKRQLSQIIMLGFFYKV